MLRDRSRDKDSSRGFSLIEMLVASAIFAIVAAVAFILYTAAQKSYKSGEQFTNQQQATRVAFDRMLSDIRLAGFNYNPDGDTTRVDEQIEGAWDTAVTIRGDFDFEDPVASITPESSLAGSSYNVVSTGNDEIVTYILAKPGPGGNTTADLWLDPDKPRSKTVKKVSIPNVVLVQDNPPYTLYRVTLADVTGAFPAAPQAASSFVFEPVADNIKSMTLQYYDDQGTKLNPDTPTSAADDIGGTTANNGIRAKIRRIAVHLVGMTRDPDMNYVDTTDASAATQNYRKFDLSSDVNPENLGKAGIKDLDVTPPSSPTNVSLVPGHCQGMLVKWDQPSSSDGVASYVVKYWLQSTPSATATQSSPYPHSEYGTIDYLGHAFVTLPSTGTWCFQVQAKDAAGNQSGWAPASSPPCATTSDSTTPAAPTGLVATGNGTLAALDSQIQVTWSQVKTNTGVLSGDPNTIGGTTILRDGLGYRLYRSISLSTFPLDATTIVADTGVLNAGVTSYTDALNIVNCQGYYYKAVTVDTCGNVSSPSTAATGQAVTTIPPAKPTGLTGTRTSASNIALAWTAVTTNANGGPTSVSLYKIYRATGAQSLTPNSIPTGNFALVGTSTTNSYNDALSATDKQTLNNGQSFYYRVSAADLCPNESVWSDGIEVNCRSGNTYYPTPATGASGGGSQPVGLSWSGSDTIVRVRAHIPSLSGSGDTYDQTSSNSGGLTSPVTLPAWNTASSGAGVYTIYWEAESTKGCVTTWTTTYTATANLACQITATNPTITPVSGKASNQYHTLAWDVQNNAGKDLTITEIDVTFTQNLGTHRAQKIEFPTGAVVYTWSPTAASKAQAFLIFPTITFCGISSGSCTTGPTLNMALDFDTAFSAIANGTTSETITVDYIFHDSSNAQGTCSLTVISGP